MNSNQIASLPEPTFSLGAPRYWKMRSVALRALCWQRTAIPLVVQVQNYQERVEERKLPLVEGRTSCMGPEQMVGHMAAGHTASVAGTYRESAM